VHWECQFSPNAAIPKPDMQNTCALKVGRLLEIRASKGFRAQADVNAFFEAIEAKLAKVPNGVQASPR